MGMGWEDKVVPVLINKTYVRVEVQLHTFLKVAIDAEERTLSHPKCSISREGAICTHSKQGESQIQFEWCREEKNLYLR
jgi:hypothetical protein